MSATLPYKLAAIDIDDTLLGRDAAISPENAAAISALRRRGVRVVLASGRSFANMLRFHDALDLGEGPLVSNHGAVVRDRAGDSWFEEPAPAAAAVEATLDGVRRGLSLIHYRRDGVYLQTHTPWTERNQTRAPTPHVVVPDLLWTGGEGVFKVMWLDEPDRISGLVAEAQALYAGRLCVTETDPGYLEFTSPTVNKAVALARVADRLGIAPAEVIAFGDGNNDVAMLEWAGLGVAMRHGRESAIAAADLVSPEGSPEVSLALAIEAVLARHPEPGRPRPAAARR